MPYRAHEELQALFPGRTWQGCDPANARYLFIGLDANFPPAIQSYHQRVIEYLTDYIQFMDRYGVHHPFLLRGYRGAGKRYHKKFADIGFTHGHIISLSFVELLHVPTIGQNKLALEDLSDQHLQGLSNTLNAGVAEHVFACASVINLMRQKPNTFPWVLAEPQADGDLKIWRRGPQCIYQMYHLSVRFPRHVAVLNRQIIQIRQILGLNGV